MPFELSPSCDLRRGKNSMPYNIWDDTFMVELKIDGADESVNNIPKPHRAVIEGNISLVEKLLEHEVNIHDRDEKVYVA